LPLNNRLKEYRAKHNINQSEMGKLVANCASSLLPYKAGKVAVSGGLVQCREYWQESFESMARECSGINEFVYNSDGIMLGTMELALNLIK